MGNRINFIDWMKAIGIFLIVYGHVASRTIEYMTFPIYPKQLGVAFFVFVMGWYLGQEKRDPVLVTYNRLFPVFLFGIGFALFMSAIVFITRHDLNESNYLPFLLGVNVLLDYFPANPTTWYIGTYIHLVLLWALILQRLRIRPWMLVGWLGIEVLIRAVLMPHGLYRAYMIFPNWGTVFLVGMFLGQHGRGDCLSGKAFPIYFLGYAVFVLLWTLATRRFVVGHAFPFREFNSIGGPWGEVARSGFVSLLYLGHTWFVFELTRRIPAPSAIRFFARNTLLIFIAHMPLWYALGPSLRHYLHNYAMFVCVNITILFVGIGMASEVITGMVKPAYLRGLLASRLGIPR